MPFRKNNRSVVTQSYDHKISIDDSVIKVILDYREFRNKEELESIINLLKKKINVSLFIVCSDRSIADVFDSEEIIVVGYDDVSLTGHMNKTLIETINSIKADILLAPIPLTSRLSLFVASKLIKGLFITFGNDTEGEYDLVINETNDDWNKKLEAFIYYLKQLNITI